MVTPWWTEVPPKLPISRRVLNTSRHISIVALQVTTVCTCA